LILGTGGASKAIAHALKTMHIAFDYVSRTKKQGVAYTYDQLDDLIIERYQIIINCTPIGTFPKIEACPDIPYQALNAEHLLFDLIYNPSETEFLRLGKAQGATTCNGYAMLEFQAEKAWEIWALV
jgi:shikimate dehydrogenase